MLNWKNISKKSEKKWQKNGRKRLAKQERKDESQQMLTRAVNLAAEAGFIRLFAEESPDLRALLLDLPSLSDPGSWNTSARKMLVEQRESRQTHSDASENSETTPTEKVEIKPGALPEPLSQRELEVLALIHAGHANKEIATKMKVAPATVKAHIRNLYGKLGVGRRTEALARARDLGLLEA